VTVLAAAVAAVIMITEAIKTATTVKVHDLLNGIRHLPHLVIHVAESSAFNNLMIAV
jgi:hypothetical protein